MKQKTQSQTVSESKQDENIFPLAIGLDNDDERTQIIGGNGWHIAYVEFSPTREMAQRIVTAVNSHDDMLEALINVTNELGEWLDAADDQFGREQNEPYQKAVEIIAIATNNQ